MLSDERKRFEREHCGNVPGLIARNSTTGDYVLPSINDAWAGWQARACLSQPAEGSAAAGKWVPLEPTPEMVSAFFLACPTRDTADIRFVDVYRAMLAAAPATGTAQQAPVSEQERRDARRYRWLRDKLTWDVSPADSARPSRAAWECRFTSNYGMRESEDNLDAAIDAALTREAGEQEGASK